VHDWILTVRTFQNQLNEIILFTYPDGVIAVVSNDRTHLFGFSGSKVILPGVSKAFGVNKPFCVHCTHIFHEFPELGHSISWDESNQKVVLGGAGTYDVSDGVSDGVKGLRLKQVSTNFIYRSANVLDKGGTFNITLENTSDEGQIEYWVLAIKKDGSEDISFKNLLDLKKGKKYKFEIKVSFFCNGTTVYRDVNAKERRYIKTEEGIISEFGIDNVIWWPTDVTVTEID